MSKIKEFIEYLRLPQAIRDTMTNDVTTDFLNSHKIVGDLQYYCDPLGDDTTGDGSMANPWYSINALFENINDYVIDNLATITLNIGEGHYAYTEQQIITHPSAKSIQIIGAEPTACEVTQVINVGASVNDPNVNWKRHVIVRLSGIDVANDIAEDDWLKIKMKFEDWTHSGGTAPYDHRPVPSNFDSWAALNGVWQIIEKQPNGQPNDVKLEWVAYDWYGSTAPHTPPAVCTLKNSAGVNTPADGWVYKTVLNITPGAAGYERTNSALFVEANLGYLNNVMVVNALKDTTPYQHHGIKAYNGSSIDMGAHVSTSFFNSGIYAQKSSTINCTHTVQANNWTSFNAKASSTVDCRYGVACCGADPVVGTQGSNVHFTYGMCHNSNAIACFFRSSSLESPYSIWYFGNTGLSIGVAAYAMLEGSVIRGFDDHGISVQNAGSVDGYWQTRMSISDCGIGIEAANNGSIDCFYLQMYDCGVGLKAEVNSAINASYCWLSNCTSQAVKALEQSIVKVDNSTLDGVVGTSDQWGLQASGHSRIQAGASIISSFYRHILAQDNSNINAYQASFSGHTVSDCVYAYRGSIVFVEGALTNGTAISAGNVNATDTLSGIYNTSTTTF